MDANTHKEKLQKILQCHGIKNKTQLLKTLSEMLRSNPIGSIIENDGLLVDILTIHYYYHSEKPWAFIVNPSSQYKTPCFNFINDKDGKLYEFSYRNCVNHSEQIKKELINKAFRAISYPDCKTFRIEKEVEFLNVSYVCPLTNEPYNVKSKDLHIDHDKHELPFHEMVTNFKNIYNFTDNDLSTKVNKDTGLYEFKNINITNLWKTYHFQNASLQLISKEANLSNKY